MTRRNAHILGLSMALLAACGGDDTHARQRDYEVVQEGAATGVTSSIGGPGESLPPITGTNADTTTAFTVDPNLAGTATTTGGSLAGTLPPAAPDTAYGDFRPAAPAPAPRPIAQPSQPRPIAQPAPSAPPRRVTPRPAPPPPTTTVPPQPAPGNPDEVEPPPTDTTGTPPPPKPDRKKEPPPPPPPPEEEEEEEDPPPPPPSSPR